MTTLTAFQLTPLGLFHTVVSLVAVVAAFAALFKDKEISSRTPIGQLYLLSLLITTLTGFPIFRHGSIGPPHIVGAVTLVALASAAVAEKSRAFGRGGPYVRTISYSATVLLLMIPAVTETLTRVPPAAPLVAGPEAPIFKPLYLILIVLFVIGVTRQVQRLRLRTESATAG